MDMDDPPGATAESTRNWRQPQRDDSIVGQFIRKSAARKCPIRKEHHAIQKLKTLLREWDRLKIINRVLYRVVF